MRKQLSNLFGTVDLAEKINIMKRERTFNREYWDNYYDKDKTVHYPSCFAEFCQDKYISDSSIILDLGCGNARDSLYFAEHGHCVIGIDYSKVVTKKNIVTSRKLIQNGKIKFIQTDFTRDLDNYGKIDVVYSRFSMHVISENDQKRLIKEVYKVLEVGGLFLIEFRTINDPLFKCGKKLSDFERFTDHYRRFIDGTKFLYDLIKIGFHVKLFIEDNKLATYFDEDPVVARYILEKI